MDYRLTEPAPKLCVTIAEAPYEKGKTLSGKISVQESGAKGLPQLYITIPQGSASITLDGAPLQAFGKWLPMTSASAQIGITPTKAGTLRILLQAKSAEGVFSNAEELNWEVQEPLPLSVEVSSQKRIVNLPASETIPVTVSIHRPEYEGLFQVKVTFVSGKGDLLYEGHIINDTEIQLGAETTLQYRPTQLGTHLLEVEASCNGLSSTGRTYMEVVRNIQVTSDVKPGFTIAGCGEYDADGEEVTLRLENDPKFNFEVDCWLDSTGKLLSREDQYTITTSCDCLCDLQVKLKRRLVNIARGPSARIDFKYSLLVNGKIENHIASDYRMQLEADYRLSDTLKFRYEYYKYEGYPLPPPTIKSSAIATMVSGASYSGYLWRVDNVFDISIHQEDNPRLTFNTYTRYIEGSSTSYFIPYNITMIK